MEHIIKTIIFLTLIEVGGILGIFFLFGIVLSLLEQRIQRQYQQTLGWKSILWTAWIGTPVHELSHVLIAKFFFYRIHEIKLFQPNKENGTLGYIEYSYNKWNPWQRIGEFFVGAAPMIVGSAILFFIFTIGIGQQNSTTGLLQLSTQSDSTIMLHTVQQSFLGLFQKENLRSPIFWMWIYISFCIVTHIAPSKRDRRAMWSGFIIIIILILAANTVAYILHKDISASVLYIKKYLGIFTMIYTYTLLVSLLHFIIISLIVYPIKKIRYRTF